MYFLNKSPISQRLPDDVQRYEERQAVEEGAQRRDRKLDLDVVGTEPTDEQLREGRDHGQPVARVIQKYEEQKQRRIEDIRRWSSALIPLV